MRWRYLLLLLLVAGCRRPPQRTIIIPRAGAGTLTLTNSGTGAATLTGDPNVGYALNIPYFAGFLSTTGTSGASSVNNGVLNIPNYATGGGGGVTLPSGSYPGQSLIVGTGNMMAAVSPGIVEAAASPTAAAAPSCGTTSSIGDLGQTFVLTAGATVTMPSATCSNATFYFFNQGASTFNATGGQTFNIYNGAAYSSASTYAAAAGQYVTAIRSKAANTWILAIGNAGGGGGGGGMVPPGSTGIISLATPSGSNAPASYDPGSGTLTIPNYATLDTPLPSGLPGQVFAIGPGGTTIAGSPGLSDSVASPVSTSPYNPSCGSVDTADRSHVTVVTAAITINIPASVTSNCNNAVFYFLMRAAATIQRSGADTFDIYNGATALTAQTSYTAAAGQYITVNNGAGTNWHMMVGYAGTGTSGGPLNEVEHYFAPDFTVSGTTTATSVGLGGTGANPINQITAASTPQLQLNYYFVIDTPTANTKIQAHIYRTTGAVPAVGQPPGGTDVQTAIVTFPYAAASALTAIGGAIFDTTGAVTGTPYRYYLALDTATAQNINIHSQSYLQVAEPK